MQGNPCKEHLVVGQGMLKFKYKYVHVVSFLNGIVKLNSMAYGNIAFS